MTFFVSYGFFFGFGCGLIYLVPINNAYYFFPQKKGIITGIIVCGLGMGSVIFNWALYLLINPTNQPPIEDPETGEEYFDPTIALDLPPTLRSLSYIYLAIAVVAVIIIFEGRDH